VIARLGLDYKTVSALNPKIVMCSVSTFGQTGPLSNRPGYDYIGASYAGVLDMIGYADRPPVFPLLGIGDVSTGVHAMGAITSALLFRERAGQGQYVETSLLDVYFHYHEANVQLISASRGAFKPRRSGAHHFLVCPCGIFKGKQNDLFIIALDQQWRSVCRAIGKPEMVEDPRFKDFEERVRNAAAIIEIIQEWLDSTKDDEEAMRVLGEHRVPFAPVLTVEQAMNHPHLRARRTVRTIKDRFLGEFDVPGFPLRFWPFRANCRSMRQPWASTTGKSCATIWDIRRSGSASSKRTAPSAAARADRTALDCDFRRSQSGRHAISESASTTSLSLPVGEMRERLSRSSRSNASTLSPSAASDDTDCECERPINSSMLVSRRDTTAKRWMRLKGERRRMVS